MSGLEQYSRVSRYLSSRNISISQNNLWLTGCIDYFNSENPNAHESDLLKYAFDQLLLADLSVIAEGCLPNSISEQSEEEFTLTGSYFLQVNYSIDICQSAYRQLQTLLKRPVTSADDEDNVQNPRRGKGRRILKMELTDGIRTVIGMERWPIPQLSTFIQPGTKIIIKGPVTCRKGILRLERHHINVLGGEVDTLCEQNRLEKILAKILNLDENQIAREMETQPDTDISVPSEIVNRLDSIPVAASGYDFYNGPEGSTNETENSRVGNYRIPREETAAASSHGRETGTRKRNTTSINTITKRPRNNETNILSNSSSSNSSRQNYEYRSAVLDNRISSDSQMSNDALGLLDDDEIFACVEDINDDNVATANVSNRVIGDEAFLDEDEEIFNYVEDNIVDERIAATSSDNVRQTPQIVVTTEEEEEEELDYEDVFGSGSESNQIMKRNNRETSTGGPSSTKSFTSDKDSVFHENKNEEIGENHIANNINSFKNSIRITEGNNSLSRLHDSSVETVTSVNNDNNPSTSRTINSEYEEEKDSSVILSCDPSGRNKLVEVDARVIAFRTNLTVKGENWHIVVKITTKEDTFKAVFDPDILDGIIGFTPAEVVLKNKIAAVNPAVKEKMSEMLKRAQKILKNLNCRMTLQYSEDNEFPIILSISDQTAFYK